MARKVLLVTTVSWVSVPRYAAGFAAAGCEVGSYSPAQAPLAASVYVAERYRYEPFTPVQSLRHAIADWKPELLVACDDRAVAILLRLAHGGSPEEVALVRRSLGKLEAYPEMLSRYGSLMAMHEEGVRVPDTWPVNQEGDLDTILGKSGFPCVVKADGSWGGEGVVIARDAAAATAGYRKLSATPSRLRSLVRAFRRRDSHFVLEAFRPIRPAISLQRFVAGTPAASAFAAWEGKVTGLICYDVLVADDTIGPPNVIRRIDDPDMEKASHAVARRFGLSGLHGLDFIRDRDGKVHLIEINPRGTQGGTLAFGPGRDLPSSLAAAAFGVVSGIRPAISNDTVVLFPREWQKEPASEWLQRGHHDVPWDDPAVLRAALGK